MEWPSYWSDLVDASTVQVTVTKQDSSVDLVKTTEQWGGVIQVNLKSEMVETNSYNIKITNVITPLNN